MNSERTIEAIKALLDANGARQYVLLSPGPVLTSGRVKAALVHHDVSHRDADFSDLIVRLQSKLRRVFRAGPDHSVAIVSGSGTSAAEMALASTVPPGGKLLVAANGAFGDRLIEIAELHGIEVVAVRHPWGAPIHAAAVEKELLRDPAIVAVAMVHHETSVGLLNPVGEVGALCRRFGRLFLVDAVSSLGGEDLDVVRDGIDLCFSSANKCLHAIAGVSFVCVDPRVWPRIAKVRPRVYSLDLARYRRYGDEIAQTPFTPAVSSFFALDAALDELLAEGLEARWAEYRRRNARIRSALAAMGIGFLTDTGRESHSILTPEVPSFIDFPTLYQRLKERGYVVYAAKPPLDRYFQIANMGALTDEMIDGFLATLRDILAEARLRARPRLRLVAGATPPPAAG